MGSPRRVVIGAGDPSREYSAEEEARLTENLLRLTKGVHAGAFSSSPLSIYLLQALHQNIFDGVRSHAGRCRGPGFGTEHLIYGPHRSCHRDEVPDLIDEVFEKAAEAVTALESDTGLPDYEQRALTLAVKLHADVIRVHPFEDGNGRASRALMNVLLVRLGFLAIPLEVPKQEYLAGLNHYYKAGDLQPLLDLALDLWLSDSF